VAPELENLKSAGDNKTPSPYNTIPQRIENWKLERGGYSSLEIVGFGCKSWRWHRIYLPLEPYMREEVVC